MPPSYHAAAFDPNPAAAGLDPHGPDAPRELAPVRAELKSIRLDLDDLNEKVENVTGFHKEIDHALERIAKIEKHLGLENKIAA